MHSHLSPRSDTGYERVKGPEGLPACRKKGVKAPPVPVTTPQQPPVIKPQPAVPTPQAPVVPPVVPAPVVPPPVVPPPTPVVPQAQPEAPAPAAAPWDPAPTNTSCGVILNNSDLGGGDLPPLAGVEGATFDACCAACMQRPDCGAFTWVPPQSR